MVFRKQECDYGIYNLNWKFSKLDKEDVNKDWDAN